MDPGTTVVGILTYHSRQLVVFFFRGKEQGLSRRLRVQRDFTTVPSIEAVNGGAAR